MKNIELNGERIILERDPKEEVKLNYTKIYDLSKLDTISNIKPEEKLNLLITIKKLLLCTNDYLDTCNSVELIRYIILTIVIFFLYIILFSPIYKIYFLSEEQANALPEINIIKKFIYYYLIEFIEILFRIIFNIKKRNKVRKIMLYYGKNELKKISNDFIVEIEDETFNLSILRAPKNNEIYNAMITKFFKEENNSFYQYVINYPNVRYYKWDKKILNEKENEICNTVILNLKELENVLVKKYSFTVFIVWALYFISFLYFTKGNVKLFLFFRFIIFVFTKVMSIYMSNDLKNNFIKREELLNYIYLLNDYFVLLSGSVINIFKIKDNYIDKNQSISEIFKNINKEVINLNEKILNQKI